MKYEPVDAVITWVDGNDVVHRQKMLDYFQNSGVDRSLPAAAPTRFNQCGEIEYCVFALLRFAPWIRTIYIVTDAQIPPVLERLAGSKYQDKVKVIDHRIIFAGYEHCLPTFNSLSIESMLWRIPDLANQFIYFNDDCMLLRPVFYQDFFRHGKPIVQGRWKRQWQKKWRHYLPEWINQGLRIPYGEKYYTDHRRVQENSARVLGKKKDFFHLPHLPFALQKETLSQFFAQKESLLMHNAQYPLRHPQQFWPISLACHLELARGCTEINTYTKKSITINGACHSEKKIIRVLKRADRDQAIQFICMQSLDSTAESLRRKMLDWLDTRIMK